MLPEAFLERMKSLLGDEYDAFLATFEKPNVRGARINTLKIDPEDYVNDVSLKGEFIRTVMEEVSDEAERGRIISYGIKALMGDSIE